ncbi:MAG TPA: glycosyltransferase, partial [Candidatus Acidoferrum sp.]|nr:glycosyltransferase [Candidatus Acidoferrum sp.]
MGRDQTITVCHLISGDLWAGPEVQIHALLKSLQSVPDLNISIIVLNEGKFAALLAEAGFRVKVIDENKNRFPGIVKQATAELTGRRIDILHSHRYKENFIATLLKKRCDVRHLVQTVHGIGEPFTGLKKLKVKLYDVLNDRATRQFDRVVAVSDDIRRELGNRYDISKVVTIHNAVDTSQVMPKRSSAEVRSELGIRLDQPVIGSVGRMVPIKGIDQFLAVAKMIAGKRPDAVLLLAGDGPQQSEYENMTRSMGLTNNVRFLGYRHDVADVLNCLDLFVMTSYHEGIPLVLLEAMTLKRPV